MLCVCCHPKVKSVGPGRKTLMSFFPEADQRETSAFTATQHPFIIIHAWCSVIHWNKANVQHTHTHTRLPHLGGRNKSHHRTSAPSLRFFLVLPNLFPSLLHHSLLFQVRLFSSFPPPSQDFMSSSGETALQHVVQQEKHELMAHRERRGDDSPGWCQWSEVCIH